MLNVMFNAMNKIRHELVPTLNWEVEKQDVFVGNDLKTNHKYQAIVRSDTQEILHIPTKGYVPTPNKTFQEIVQLVSETTNFECAGFQEYQGGKKVLAFLKNPEKIKVAGFQFEDYMIIGNSHDGTTPLFVGTHSLMLRCANQYSTFIKNLKNGNLNKFVAITHTKSANEKMQSLKQIFVDYFVQTQKLYEVYEVLSKVVIDENIINALLKRLVDAQNEEKLSTRKDNIKANISASIHRECSDIGYNALGLFEGVTHYTTHVMNAKEKVFGNLFGTPKIYNDRAFEFVKSLAEIN